MRSDDFASIGGHPAIALHSAADAAAHIKALGPDYYDAWVQKAQPGARVVYGLGLDAPSAAGPGVAARLRELSEAGLVRLHLARRARMDGNYPIDFIAVRRTKPVPKGFPLLPRERAPTFNCVGKVGSKVGAR